MSVKLKLFFSFCTGCATTAQNYLEFSVCSSLRQCFYYTVHAERAFLRELVAFGSRLESNRAYFSSEERPQLIDFQPRETKSAALGGREITACLTEVTTIGQKQRVRKGVSSFISQAQGPASQTPEGWKVEGEN